MGAFKIGSVYRNRAGNVVQLCVQSALGQTYLQPETAYANQVDETGTVIDGAGICRLLDGRLAGLFEGRTHPMDLIPGELTQTPYGWVALGAEKQGNRLLTADELNRDLRRLLDEVGRAVVKYVPIPEYHKGAPQPVMHPADARMIARDGPKTTPRHLVKAILQDLATPLSTAKPNPFPAFRSPDFCGDHLNASRHQMAAKQFHKA